MSPDSHKIRTYQSFILGLLAVAAVLLSPSQSLGAGCDISVVLQCVQLSTNASKLGYIVPRRAGEDFVAYNIRIQQSGIIYSNSAWEWYHNYQGNGVYYGGSTAQGIGSINAITHWGINANGYPFSSGYTGSGYAFVSDPNGTASISSQFDSYGNQYPQTIYSSYYRDWELPLYDIYGAFGHLDLYSNEFGQFGRFTVNYPLDSAGRALFIDLTNRTELTYTNGYSLNQFIADCQQSLPPWPAWERAAPRASAYRLTSLTRHDYWNSWLPTVLGPHGPPVASFGFSMGKFKARFVVFGPRDQEFELKWVERFTPFNGTAPVDTWRSMNVTCTGRRQIFDLGVFDPPSQQGSISILFDNQLACGASGCTIGSGSAANQSAMVKINLGTGDKNQPAGYIVLHEEAPGARLTSPESLEVIGGEGVNEIWQGGLLKQIITPSRLVNVVVTSASQYELKIYPRSATPGGDGLYSATGAMIERWLFDDSGQAGNSLKVTRFPAGAASEVVGDFTWIGAESTWELAKGTGADRKYERKKVTSDGNVETQLMTVLDADRQEVRREVKKYRTYTDPALGRKLIEHAIGSPTAPKVSQWEYYDADPVQFGYGKIRLKVEPTGRWERYEYDQYGRTKKLTAQFLNAPSTSTDAESRVTEYTYANELTDLELRGGVPGPLLDDPLQQTNTPRIVVAKILGQAISKHRTMLMVGVKTERLEPGVWTAPTEVAPMLETVTRTYLLPNFDGVVESVLNPNGTMELRQTPNWHPGIMVTNIAYVGKPAASLLRVIAGTMTVIVRGLDGNTLSATTYDIESGLVTDTQQFSYDANGRFIRTDYPDGTFSTSTYGCCGVESQTERDGSVTTFAYDSLGRLAAETRNGISTIHEFDASGNEVAVKRQGRDGSIVTLSSSVYGLDGELISTTAPGNRTTTRSQSIDANGQVVITTTNPDNTTRVETYAQDGTLLKVSGTAVHAVRYEYGPNWVNEIKLDELENDTEEWVQTFTDFSGNSVETRFADDNKEFSFYHLRTGQLLAQKDADGVVHAFAYNGFGEQEYSAVLMHTNALNLLNGLSNIQFAGQDRITRMLSFVTNVQGVVMRRTETFVWREHGKDAATRVAVSESDVSGHMQRRESGTGTQEQRSDYLGSGRIRVTTVSSEGRQTLAEIANGKVMLSRQRDAAFRTLEEMHYEYDPHDRLWREADCLIFRTNTYTYDETENIATATVTTRDVAQPPVVSIFLYDRMNRLTNSASLGGVTNFNEFYSTGEPKRSYGNRTYPVEYTYDHVGRMKTMKTWQNVTAGTGEAVTTWNYHAQRGAITQKAYADGKGPSYSYTPAGRLQTRTWARGVITTYEYDRAGSMTNITYSGPGEDTPSTALTLDRLGRPTRAERSEIPYATTFAYNNAGAVTTEAIAQGLAGSLVITNNYDGLNRRIGMAVFSSQTPLFATTQGYDGAGRLAGTTNVANGIAHAYIYSYDASSKLLGSTEFQRGNISMMLTSRARDSLHRIQRMASQAAGGAHWRYDYAYNATHQRTRTTFTDNSRWDYNYDALGQVTNAVRKWADGSMVAGQQFAYSFDDIGNRLSAGTGGDTNGQGLRLQGLIANELNQLTSRTVPGFLEVMGIAQQATVNVNGQAVERHEDYFRKELAVGNSNGPVLQAINLTVTKSNATNTVTGYRFVSAALETYAYDLDGNLTMDGRFAYTWDGENRLVAAETHSNIPVEFRRKLNFVYDHIGRRVKKLVSVWNTVNGGYQLSNTLNYLYDGWNCVAEWNESNTLLQSYTWGSDLSGTIQGAGGVGGLLAVTLHTGTNIGTYFVTQDGAGNVTALVNSERGTTEAEYDYGPFGELIRASGPVALSNPFRFSTKYQDPDTGLLYYGYRYYHPDIGRWLSRDPIEESGGFNLFGMCGNDSVNNWDYLGQKWHLKRNGLSRALVWFDADSDTVADLAKTVGLDASSVSKWLRDANQRAVTSPKKCVLYTVPNTVIVVTGTARGTLDPLGVVSKPYLQTYSYEVTSAFEGRGYKTVWLDKNTSKSLTSLDITSKVDGSTWGIAFFGHGKSDGDLVIQVGTIPTEIEDHLGPDNINTGYRLGAALIYHCHGEKGTWPNKVSTNGKLRRSSGIISIIGGPRSLSPGHWGSWQSLIKQMTPEEVR